MDRYAVIGNPVAHSRSPQIHRLFAAATHQSLSYEALLAPRDGFAPVLRAFVAAGGRGANVTLPFKEEAAALVDTVADSARQAGAVNTIVVEAGGRLTGHNTDGDGLVRDLTDRLGFRLAGARVLMLGAGGAARGVIGPLLGAGAGAVVLCNRTRARAEAVAACFDARVRVVESGSVTAPFELVVNATSAPLTGAPVPIPPRAVDAGTTFYDMVYGDAARPGLELARALGAGRVSDGLGMLVEQAASAFAFWRHVRPQTQPVIDALRAALGDPAAASRQ